MAAVRCGRAPVAPSACGCRAEHRGRRSAVGRSVVFVHTGGTCGNGARTRAVRARLQNPVRPKTRTRRRKPKELRNNLRRPLFAKTVACRTRRTRRKQRGSDRRPARPLKGAVRPARRRKTEVFRSLRIRRQYRRGAFKNRKRAKGSENFGRGNRRGHRGFEGAFLGFRSR